MVKIIERIKKIFTTLKKLFLTGFTRKKKGCQGEKKQEPKPRDKKD